MAAVRQLTMVKVGGSLAERGDPRPAMAALKGLAAQHPLLVVPGGAAFAEAVRQEAKRFGLSEPRAHWMALLAMDQYGLLLAELGGGYPATDLADAIQSAYDGRLTVLLPSQVALRSPLPWSWQITSDTVAAWLASEAGAARLILLKDVDGALEPTCQLIPRLGVADLPPVVDHGFAAWLAPGIRCWIVNGLVPERIGQLLATGETVGTEVLV
jgi:5-(aminomethyl)-3-furanmethanol phosphate kinase